MNSDRVLLLQLLAKRIHNLGTRFNTLYYRLERIVDHVGKMPHIAGMKEVKDCLVRAETAMEEAVKLTEKAWRLSNAEGRKRAEPRAKATVVAASRDAQRQGDLKAAPCRVRAVETDSRTLLEAGGGEASEQVESERDQGAGDSMEEE